jgi:thioredoxin 1
MKFKSKSVLAFFAWIAACTFGASAIFTIGCAEETVSERPAAHAAVEITSANFEELKASGKPIVLDFWATWCGPCVAIGPTVEEVAQDYEGRVIVGKVNVDEQPELAEEFDIQTIPALYFLGRNGEEVSRSVGIPGSTDAKEFLTGRIEDLLAK